VIVDDNVEGTTNRVRGQRGHLEGPSRHTKAGKGGIAVNLESKCTLSPEFTATRSRIVTVLLA
jgi:hypothetical protein